MYRNTDVQIHGGGYIASPSVRLTTNALPEVQSHSNDENSQTGVSTRSSFISIKGDNITSQWYVLRCAYGREKRAHEYLLKEGVRSFHPTVVNTKIIRGKKKNIEESLMPNLLFAQGTFDSLKGFVYDNFHDETKYLRFCYEHHLDGTKQPLIVPDRQMESLFILCSNDNEKIVYKPSSVAKFQKGQKVVVTEGPFAGVEGIVARFMGQQRVGIVIEGLFTMTTAYVPSAFMKKIV